MEPNEVLLKLAVLLEGISIYFRAYFNVSVASTLGRWRWQRRWRPGDGGGSGGGDGGADGGGHGGGNWQLATACQTSRFGALHGSFRL